MDMGYTPKVIQRAVKKVGRKLFWKPRKGDKILISKLPGQHLINCINFLEAYARNLQEFEMCEVNFFGDMFDEAEDREGRLYLPIEDFVPDVYWSLRLQFNKRQLKEVPVKKIKKRTLKLIGRKI